MRARQTLDRIAEGFGEAADVPMLIGHQPAIGELALTLAGPGPHGTRGSSRPRRWRRSRFGALGPGSPPGSAGLVAFVKPRELGHRAS